MRAAVSGPRSDAISASSISSSVASSKRARPSPARLPTSRSDVRLKPPSSLSCHDALVLIRFPFHRHAGRVPASKLQRAMTPVESWTPEQVRSDGTRSEEHTSELQSLMRNSYAVLCLKKKSRSQNTKDLPQTIPHIK